MRVGQFPIRATFEPDPRLAIRQNHADIVMAARRYVKTNRLCHECGTRLVPIGHARVNGAPHADWVTRRLHKGCWQRIMKISGFISGDETDDEVCGALA